MEEVKSSQIKAQCGKSILNFSKKVLPVEYVEHGVLTSEAFAFCAFCDLFEVDFIIESGVGNGGSFLIWCKYFKDRVIRGFDIKPLSLELKSKLTPYKYEFSVGDSLSKLPDYLKRLEGSRIAVFIDGPKREASISLAKQCYDFPWVTFVGIHDLHKNEIDLGHGNRGKKPNNARLLFDSWEGPKFCTDEPWFVEKYAYLDTHIMSSGKSNWKPGGYYGHKVFGTVDFGSYGFTVGFMLKGGLCW